MQYNEYTIQPEISSLPDCRIERGRGRGGGLSEHYTHTNTQLSTTNLIFTIYRLQIQHVVFGKALVLIYANCQTGQKAAWNMVVWSHGGTTIDTPGSGLMGEQVTF